jgi:hypothetical protein
MNYVPVIIFIAVIYLLDATVGSLIDRVTRRREAIRVEALKHLDKMMDRWEQ